jgi:hypothetical protein
MKSVDGKGSGNDAGVVASEPQGERVTLDRHTLDRVLESGRSEMQSGDSVTPTLRAVAFHVLAQLPKDARRELLPSNSPENDPVVDAMERATGRVATQLRNVLAAFGAEVRQIASTPDIYRQGVDAAGDGAEEE